MTAYKAIQSHLAAREAGRVEPGSMLDRLLCYWAWCELGGCMIRDVHSQIIALRLNGAQMRVFAVMLKQAAAGKPIRLSILKSRKHGISTLIQTLCGFLCGFYEDQRAITIAHEADATDEIFEIARFCATHMELDDLSPEPERHRVKFANTRSLYRARTAGGDAVGAGGTPNMLHLSEGPKWTRNKKETWYNSTIAVPDVPESIIAQEFTPLGRELFFQQFDKASDPDSPYEPIFLPWYLDARCTVDFEGRLALDEDERRLRVVALDYGIELTDGQLMWRRRKILEITAVVFRQEYPSTPEEGIQGSRGLILPGIRGCIIDHLPFDPEMLALENLVGGIDFGYHDPTVIWSGFYVDQTLYLVDCYRKAKGLARQHVDGMATGVTYYCDPAALSDRRELSRAAYDAGLRCTLIPAPRRKVAGEDPSVRELKLLNQLVADGRIKVLRGCSKQLVLEADNFMWNESQGKPDDTRSEDCAHFDTIYALKYLTMGVCCRPPARKSYRTDEERPLSRRAQFAAY